MGDSILDPWQCDVLIESDGMWRMRSESGRGEKR